MRNVQPNPSVFRLRDSGSSGVWRSVAEVPEYAVEEAAPAEDYVQRMNQQLWSRPTVRINTLKEAAGRAPNKAASAAWDLAVAFAVHALGVQRGPARDRAEARCLDAMEAAIDAGHARPGADHPDFASVAANPRFLAIAATNLRRPA
ncbi:MAG: hypothetical protein H6841_00525 [Planctomycetes bacterium]|nr:hypothetical protein [Planctomycetota bacterium]MCB9935873.1 hypothetical protein [Planctomycetota bacterium]